MQPSVIAPVLATAVVLVGLVGVPPADAASYTCHGHRATIVGTPGADTLRGTPRRDVIVGRSGDDVIYGRGGDDLVCGGKDEDVLRGGRGDDDLYGGGDRYQWTPDATYFFGDHLDGGPGDDLLDAGYDSVARGSGDHLGTPDVLDFGHGAGVRVDLATGRATGQGHDLLVDSPELAVTGSAHDDVLRGSAGPDWLDGGAGDDEVYGGGGVDSLVSRSGADTLSGGADRDDLVVDSSGRTSVDGGPGLDVIHYAAVVEGSAVSGGPGTDVLDWSATSSAEATLDIVAGTLTQDGETVAIRGLERWRLAADRLTVRGTEGPDYLDVARASTTMTLLGGDDRVTASGTGDDTVDGGDGTDFADLGGGANSCTGVELGPC
ncbi:MAG: Hemolysin-type calcium-binding region [Nocardioides sp.]|nr:Hemolysin-type calcium-binding region [Nocardioides sp.]